MSVKPVLKTDTVETFTHPKIANEPVEMEGLPFGDDFFVGEVPIAIKHVPGTGDERLVSLGNLHGRSYVLNETADPNQAWTDRYGNPFTTLSTKGNNFSRPDMVRSATAPSGFLPYGLQEGDSLLRVLRASRLMREGGVDTEWIVRVEEPKQLNFKGRMVEPAEYKQLLLASCLGETAINGSGVDITESAKEASDIAAAIKDMDFFVTLRAMATPYRASEMINVDLQAMREVFDAYNLIAPHRSDDFEMLGLPKSLGGKLEHPEDSLDLLGTDAEVYFAEVLPKLLGLNFARMHNLNLVHNFGVGGNITALGGIIDLDGVKGPALGLGDKQPGSAEFASDLNQFINDQLDTFRLLFNDLFPEPIGNENRTKVFEAFATNLLVTYLNHRDFGMENNSGHQDVIAFLIHLNNEAEFNIPLYLPKVEAYEHIGNFLSQEVVKAIEGMGLDKEEFASQVYERAIKGNEKEIWDLRSNNPKTPPNQEQLYDETVLWFMGPDAELDKDGIAEDTLIQFIYPVLRSDIESRLSSHMSDIIRNARSEFGGEISDLSSAELIALYCEYVIGAVEDNLYRIMPSIPDFREMIGGELKNNYLDGIELDFDLGQDLIDIDNELLAEHFQFWELHRGRLIRAHSKVSEEDALQLLKDKPEAEHFAPAENESSFAVFDLLNVSYSENETVRLVITDGDLASWEDTETGIGNGQRLYSLDILQPEDKRPTYGIFLIENFEDKTFRVVHKKIKADSKKLQTTTDECS